MSNTLLATGHAYLVPAWISRAQASLGKAILAIGGEPNRLTRSSKEKLEITSSEAGGCINQTHLPLGFLAE